MEPLVLHPKAQVSWSAGVIHVSIDSAVFKLESSVESPWLLELLHAFARPAQCGDVVARFVEEHAPDVDEGTVEEVINALLDEGILRTEPVELPGVDATHAETPARPAPTQRREPRSPVLLLGEGVGLLYLAAHLRRANIETWVVGRNATPLRPFLLSVLAILKPKVVGISLKWFHHLAWALEACATIRDLAPDITIVIGGNTATYWWRELIAFPCIDYIVLGDGEQPIQAICQGAPFPPNCVFRSGTTVIKTPQDYVQRGDASSRGLSLEGVANVFLSKEDMHRSLAEAWILAGKGCSRHCCYCAGCRRMQNELFGRARPFLRPLDDVLGDMAFYGRYSAAFRFDFDDPAVPGAERYYRRLFDSFPLSDKAIVWWSWSMPSPSFVEQLASVANQVKLSINLGCLSERQRRFLAASGDLKDFYPDHAIFALLDEVTKYPNVTVAAEAVSGLPFANLADLDAERKLLERLLSYPCFEGSSHIIHPLEFQPGSSISDSPERFGLISPIRGFRETLEWFRKGLGMPQMRYADEELQLATEEWRSAAWALLPGGPKEKPRRSFTTTTRLRYQAGIWRKFTYSARDWKGFYGVEAPMSEFDAVTFFVNAEGCSTVRFHDARLVEAVLGAFSSPNNGGAVYEAIGKGHAVSPESFAEIISMLETERFLRRSD